MSNNDFINIRISKDELQDFCQKVLKRSRDISKTHDALITLESFISVFGRPSHGTIEYQTIESTIKEITESSRQQLLKKSTIDLIEALKLCNAKSLAMIHTPLSRNGFYQILQTAIETLTDDDIRLVMLWSANWLKEASELAQKASGYPDAMDFKKAEISFEEFQAITDIDRVLNPKS
ncbi:MAG: hypothetical protein DIZ80_03185 [endosymbiont of Galathealinum brachiosum]|uniref:Uncharacterized protein n=1 Tax=endosymbiont of Galathealinum brachiosum TaxID=2200906 RepID=A0A370DJM6_9GAMM|nr:MAG: hypothetical protein DIZ80_03185 [endosymbiont of Galathealinum brachiosum]